MAGGKHEIGQTSWWKGSFYFASEVRDIVCLVLWLGSVLTTCSLCFLVSWTKRFVLYSSSTGFRFQTFTVLRWLYWPIDIPLCTKKMFGLFCKFTGRCTPPSIALIIIYKAWILWIYWFSSFFCTYKTTYDWIFFFWAPYWELLGKKDPTAPISFAGQPVQLYMSMLESRGK